MDYQLRPVRAKDRTSSSKWSRFVDAHSDTLRRCETAARAALSTPEREAELDRLLRELVQLEKQMLAYPAPDADALRLKLALWADGKVEGFEDEWRVFMQDCERLLKERETAA